MQPIELSRETLCTGKFLKYENIKWRTADGQEKIWEVVERMIGRQAVLIIPWLKPSNRLVLIRQYRPPANAYIIEFPAGLIEENEAPEIAAIRELREEAGYAGKVTRIIPPTYNTPGLSSETVYNVFMEIDDHAPHQPQPDDGEHIELLLVARDDFAAFIDREIAAGNQFDSKVMAYIQGMINFSSRQ